MHAAISLIVSLLGVAGLYLMQQAEFLFAVQIILYVGGIMLLFLFVIMLVNLDEAAKQRQFNRQWMIALVAVVAVGAQVGYFIYRGQSSFHFAAPLVGGTPAGLGTWKIADALFRRCTCCRSKSLRFCCW
jgi:NADH-quinone oxidoreductase subunit J